MVNPVSISIGDVLFTSRSGRFRRVRALRVMRTRALVAYQISSGKVRVFPVRFARLYREWTGTESTELSLNPAPAPEKCEQALADFEAHEALKRARRGSRTGVRATPEQRATARGECPHGLPRRVFTCVTDAD